mmetsp:Transcript_36028/g.95663  ORF Transcript_36028/g.95663 Transcript_36028/m.95663 type:complete len:215 (+) Transcript_36028:447-1091(+)
MRKSKRQAAGRPNPSSQSHFNHASVSSITSDSACFAASELPLNQNCTASALVADCSDDTANLSSSLARGAQRRTQTSSFAIALAPLARSRTQTARSSPTTCSRRSCTKHAAEPWTPSTICSTAFANSSGPVKGFTSPVQLKPNFTRPRYCEPFKEPPGWSCTKSAMQASAEALEFSRQAWASTATVGRTFSWGIVLQTRGAQNFPEISRDSRLL